MFVIYPQPHDHDRYFNGSSHHSIDYEALLAHQYRQYQHQVEQERLLQIERQRRYQQQQLREARERQAKEAERQLLAAYIASVVQEVCLRMCFMGLESEYAPQNTVNNEYLGHGRFGAPPLRHGGCTCHEACNGPTCLDRFNSFLTQYAQPPRPAQCRIAPPVYQQQPHKPVVAPRQAVVNPLEALFGALAPLAQAVAGNEHAQEESSDPELFDLSNLVVQAKPAPKARQVEAPKPKQVEKKQAPAVKGEVASQFQPQVHHVTFEDLINTVIEESKVRLHPVIKSAWRVIDASSLQKEYERRAKSSAPSSSAAKKDDASKPALNKEARDPNVKLERKPALRKPTVDSIPAPASVSSPSAPAVANEVPKKSKVEEEEKEAEAAAAAAEQARLIRLYDSLTSLTSIRAEYINAQEKVTGSPRSSHLDLATTNEDPSSDAADPNEARPLSPTDTKVYEEALLRLLERLDGVDSDGDDVIRFTRRSLARELADELEALDKYKAEVEKYAKAEVQSEAATDSVVDEVVKEEAGVQAEESKEEVAPSTVEITSPVAEESALPVSTPAHEVESAPAPVDIEIKTGVGEADASSGQLELSNEPLVDEPEAQPLTADVQTAIAITTNSSEEVRQLGLEDVVSRSVQVQVDADEKTEEEATLPDLPDVPQSEPIILEEPEVLVNHTFPPSSAPSTQPVELSTLDGHSTEDAEAPSSESSSSSSPSIHSSEVEVENPEASPALTGIGSDVVVLSDEEEGEDQHDEETGDKDGKFELL